MFLTPTCLPLPPTCLPACLPQAELFCSWSSAIVTSNTILHKVDTRIRIWLLGQSSPRIVNGTISTNNVCTEEGQHNAQSTCASSPSSTSSFHLASSSVYPTQKKHNRGGVETWRVCLQVLLHIPKHLLRSICRIFKRGYLWSPAPSSSALETIYVL